MPVPVEAAASWASGCWGQAPPATVREETAHPMRGDREGSPGPFDLLTEASALPLQQEGLCDPPGTPVPAGKCPRPVHPGSVPAPAWLCITSNFVYKVVSTHPPKEHLGSDALLSWRPEWELGAAASTLSSVEGGGGEAESSYFRLPQPCPHGVCFACGC